MIDGEVFLWVGVAGVGLLLMLSAQPLGAPRPSLSKRLDALRPDRRPPENLPSVFGLSGLDSLLVPALRALGELAIRAGSFFGLDPESTARRLRAAGEPYGPALFFGQKVAGLLVGAVLPAILGVLGIGPSSGWPLWVFIPSMLLGFMGPDIGLNARVQRRRREMLSGLASATRLMTLAVSAGYGVEQAIVEVATSGRGAFFDELALRISKAKLKSRGAVDALSDLAQDAELSELQSLAGALTAASRQGVPALRTLRAQAEAAHERWRLGVVEAGERAAVTMLLPIGVLILPAFFLVVLYPAAANLTKLSGL